MTGQSDNCSALDGRRDQLADEGRFQRTIEASRSHAESCSGREGQSLKRVGAIA